MHRDDLCFTWGMTKMTQTHETFIHRVRDFVLSYTDKLTNEERTKLEHVKIVYGVGAGYRGVTVYQAWKNSVGTVDLIEVAASGEENWIQLAGTTIHELAHVISGAEAGHGPDWKTDAVRLGFRVKPKVGQTYTLAMFPPKLRSALYELASTVSDGDPNFLFSIGNRGRSPKPCGAGLGTRGGKSRGTGSGSRLRLYECACQPKPVKVRVASDDFRATCDVCLFPFIRQS